jgi:hypothetical protein
MKKIGDYDPFFDFLLEALGWRQTKSYNSKNVGNLQAGKFLKYLKESEPFSFLERREKRQCFKRFSIFFRLTYYGKNQTTKPALRVRKICALKKTLFFQRSENRKIVKSEVTVVKSK